MIALRRFASLAAWIISTICIPETASLWQDSFILDFNYDLSSSSGPNNWYNVSDGTSTGGWGEWSQYDEGNPITFSDLPIRANECGNSDLQSPLNLFQTASCPDTHEIITRKIGINDCNQSHLLFYITPYSMRAYFPLVARECFRPSIKVGDVDDPFGLAWMELHARSEHVVDGRRFDAELQMVHLGTGNSTSQLLTVSVLIDASSRTDNAEFQFYLDEWQIVGNGNSPQSCVRRNLEVANSLEDYRASIAAESSDWQEDVADAQDDEYDLMDARDLQIINSCKPDRFGKGCEPLVPREKMFPYSIWPSIWYYGYEGSITTPPCSSIVNWRVLDEPLRISRRQYKQMASLMTMSKNSACENDTAVSSQGENFRPLQQANQFPSDVFHCTFANFSFLVYDVSNS